MPVQVTLEAGSTAEASPEHSAGRSALSKHTSYRSNRNHLRVVNFAATATIVAGQGGDEKNGDSAVWWIMGILTFLIFLAGIYLIAE